MWIELAQIVASNAFTVIVVGYVLNKRLERQKVFISISEQFMSALVLGLNNFMGDFKAVVVKAEEVEKGIKEGTYNEELFKECLKRIQQYQETIRASRIYLTPLIPFGTSEEDVGVQAMFALSLLCDRTLRKRDVLLEGNRDTVVVVVKNLRDSYKVTTARANELLRRLHAGKKFL